MDEPRYAKIAISIPKPLLDRLERLRASAGTSRSRMIREAVTEYVVAAEREELRRQAEEAYGRMPETEEELALVDAALRGIASYIDDELPWDGPVPDRDADG